MTTTPRIQFGSNAFEIKSDATFSLFIGALQPFSDLNDLENGEIAVHPYATFEPDYWVLDGNFKFVPTGSAHAGLIGDTLSNSPNGNFATVLDMTIDFSTVHSTSGGLSFLFSAYTDDYLDFIDIKYYDASIALIREDIYHPTGTTFSTNQAVSNFKRIHITLNSTNKPFRYPRIASIDFDTVTTFSGSEIKLAQLVEQISPLSTELPMNTLDFELFSSSGDFSIVNPTGVYANLQYKQPVEAFEDINGLRTYLGRFYLDEWNSQSENLADFKASDAIGILDKTTNLGGYIGSHNAPPFDIAVSGILDTLFSPTNIDYELDPSLTGTLVTGYLPVGSAREALQQIAIAIGAYVTCARSNKVLIKPTELASAITTYDQTITQAQKGLGQPVVLRPLVTQVNVNSHIFTNKYRDVNVGDPKQFMTASLSSGTHRIVFDELQYNVYITEATITAPTVGDFPCVFGLNLGGLLLNGYTNYIDISMNGARTVYLQSEATFTDTSKTVSVSNSLSSLQNVIEIPNATIITPDKVSTIAQLVYDYYQQRYLQKARLYASSAKVGDAILIDTQSNAQIKGILEKMTTDLAGGFKSDVEIVGVVA